MLTAWKLRTGLAHCFGLAGFKFCPALPGGLRRIHAGLKFGFFEKIPPALVAIVGRLLLFQATHGDGRTVLAADNFNYSARDVGSHVVTDDCVAGLRFVTCQIFPV